MLYRRSFTLPWSVSILLLLMGFSSCEKFSGDQTIPAYLTIDSVSFSTDYDLQGSASHIIPDAWVYVDDELIGAFPLPANLPILRQGSHKIKILPGIKKNGIAATRIHYPFYGAVVKTINLVPDVHTSFGAAETAYVPEVDFLWIEDFEGLTISLDTTPRSAVPIRKTLPGTPMTFERQHSGLVQSDTTGVFFECISHQDFNIPDAAVFLEMDFNINKFFTVGVMIYSGAILYESPVMDLMDTEGKWKKIYIDLTTTLNSIPGATRFHVYFRFKETSVYNAQILLDNIKLLTYKTGK